MIFVRLKKEQGFYPQILGLELGDYSNQVLESCLFQLFPKAIQESMALQGLKQKSHSTLIPEKLSKPPQPFHGITLDGQIKIPSSNGSSDEVGCRERRESTEERAAGCTLQPYLVFFFPASAFVFPRRIKGRGEQTFLFN